MKDLSLLHSVLISKGKPDTLVHINFKTTINQTSRKVYSETSDSIETSLCVYSKKSAEMTETVALDNCHIFIKHDTPIIEVGNCYVIKETTAISGTMRQEVPVINEAVQNHIEKHSDEEFHLIIPKSRILNFRCKNFEFLKRLIDLKPKRMSFEVDLSKWSCIEYLSEANIIQELPADSYIDVKLAANNTILNEFSFGDKVTVEPVVLPQEMSEALMIITKFFLLAHCDSIEFADILNSDNAINVLAILMDENYLQSLSIISPCYKIATVIADNMLKFKNLTTLNVYAKGKDYLSECIREKIKVDIVKNFYKDIRVDFQLPLSLSTFSNAKVL